MTVKKSATESELEIELDRLYREGGRLGYWANRFYQLFTPGCKHYKGGVEAVRRIVAKGRSSGFEFAVKHDRTDLLLEHVVLSSKWQHLFEPSLQEQARQNLATLKK